MAEARAAALEARVVDARGAARVALLDQAARARAEAADLLVESEASIAQAAHAYATLLDEPAFERWVGADEALLRAGAFLSRYGHEDRARAALERLLRRAPHSTRAGEAHVILGDVVREHDARHARDHYAEALRRLPPPAIDVEIRIAAIDLELGDPPSALERFAAAVVKAASSTQRRTALAGAAEAFVASGDKDPRQHFARLVPGHELTAMRAVAELYIRRGQSDLAVSILDELAGRERDACPTLVLKLQARADLAVASELAKAAVHSDDDCRREADKEIGALALARSANAREAVRFWELALTVVTTRERRDAMLLDRAYASWRNAAHSQDPKDWLGAATAFEAAAMAMPGVVELSRAASDARTNARAAGK